MIRALLWDIDGTVLDFLAAERVGIHRCFARFSLGVCTDEMLNRYSAINRLWWEKLERGECTKPETLAGRFRDFFAAEGIPFDRIDELNLFYQDVLGETTVFFPGAEETLLAAKGRFFQAAVTNGTRRAQRKKLALTGLDTLLDAVFISDEVGFEKPSPEFFNAVFAGIPPFAKDEILIIGDSLSSDMKGGKAAGIRTCHYCPRPFSGPDPVGVDHRVASFSEIRKLLGV